jgi:Zn-finger nucleic acid-binding protein
MKCPVCDVDLLMGERLSVSIDYCPKCRGIWLANGKLDNLLGRSGANSDPRNKNQNRRDDDDEGGIGGFLKGIFD